MGCQKAGMSVFVWGRGYSSLAFLPWVETLLWSLEPLLDRKLVETLSWLHGQGNGGKAALCPLTLPFRTRTVSSIFRKLHKARSRLSREADFLQKK